MKNRSKIFNSINAADSVVIAFLFSLTALNLFFCDYIAEWQANSAFNLALIALIMFAALQDKKNSSWIWEQIHLWYLVPFVFIVFKELHTMIDPIREMTYDETLIKIDRFIFGTDPTKALFKISNPLLTEILQIIYGTFFFLPVILGVDLKLQKKSYEFDYSAFIIVFGFILSFLGYILVPAIGPRFTLHNFGMNNIEMPGLAVTDFLRSIVNGAEGITMGVSNPAAVVQRDCFPSGHTQMTLLVIFLSVKFKSRARWFFIINGTLLIFATVYLRYHYVADLIGGLIFMILTLTTGKYLYRFLSRNNKDIFTAS